MKKESKRNPIISFIKSIPYSKSIFLFIWYFLLRKPFCNKKINIRINEKMNMLLDYTFGLHKYEKFGDRHNAGFQKWIDACRGKRIVFDVGAHIGLYSLPASQVVGEEGKVFAFEPSLANCKFLNKHISYNQCSNIEVYPFLVGAYSRKKVLFCEHPDPNAMNALVVGKDKDQYDQTYKEQVDLNSFCNKNNVVPEILKIDVEGAELKVLKGARKILTDASPIIFLSVHPRRLLLMKDSVEELVVIIKELGYVIEDSEGNKTEELSFGEYLLTKP